MQTSVTQKYESTRREEKSALKAVNRHIFKWFLDTRFDQKLISSSDLIDKIRLVTTIYGVKIDDPNKLLNKFVKENKLYLMGSGSDRTYHCDYVNTYALERIAKSHDELLDEQKEEEVAMETSEAIGHVPHKPIMSALSAVNREVYKWFLESRADHKLISFDDLKEKIRLVSRMYGVKINDLDKLVDKFVKRNNLYLKDCGRNRSYHSNFADTYTGRQAYLEKQKEALEAVDREILDWFVESRFTEKIVFVKQFRAKFHELAKRYGVQNVRSSEWLEKFLKRHNIYATTSGNCTTYHCSYIYTHMFKLWFKTK
ncbi:unnamed protein product [Callosobruchus maculatus]|uniref:HTH CENPB-type domain-containing protein n=1 Tax=Callosobruchus maculatus TaxID=64391 RepID=A0A653D531_CALMS|nr:unnamed protein product [Callosobruchus maculatus]